MTFVTAYGPKTPSRTTITDQSMTKQSMKKESDINFIVAKYRKTGLIDHLAVHQGDYGEFEAIDFHEAMLAVRDAEEMFLTVPSDIRKEFANDPGLFLNFVTDPANLDKMREMGLAPPAPSSPAKLAAAAPEEISPAAGVSSESKPTEKSPAEPAPAQLPT